MKEIQTQIKHNSIEQSINKNFIQNKAQSGIKNRKIKQVPKIENIKATVANTTANAVKVTSVAGKAAATTVEAAMPSETGNADDIGAAVADDVKHTAADVGKNVADYAQSAAQNHIKSISSKKALTKKSISSSVISSVGEKGARKAEKINKTSVPNRYVNPSAKPQLSNVAKNRIKSISNNKTIIQKAVSSPTILHSVNRSIKRAATNKIKSAKQKVITSTAKKSAMNLVSVASAAKISQKISFLRKSNERKNFKRAKIRGTGKVKVVAEKVAAAVGKTTQTVQKGAAAFTSTDSDNQVDIGENISRQLKDTATKAADKGIEKTAQGVKNVSKSLKSSRSIQTAQKHSGINKTIHTAQKRTIQKTVKATGNVSKKSVKTSAKAAKNAAKATKTTAKTTVKTTKTASKTTAKIIGGIAKAVGSLIVSPAGPIILIIAAVVLLIVLIVSIISGAAGAVSGATAAVVSPLNWIFGSSASSSTEDLKDAYEDYLDMATAAYKDIADYMEDTINDYSLDDNDILEFNGASITPASSGAYSVKTMLQDSADDIDWTYFIEVYYIYMQRTVDNPELTKEGMYEFMMSEYYSLETSEETGITCPTADCETDTYWCISDDYCPDVTYDEEDDITSCPGHEYSYCPGNHKKVTITFEVVPNILDVLGFTDEEKERLELGLNLLDELFAEEEP